MSNISTYTLSCGSIEMLVTNFGARVMKLFVPDKNGKMADVVFGYNTIEEYLDNKGERYLGAACGRYANRIANGSFEIDGQRYSLPKNNNGQTLHGGPKGLDSLVWDVVEYSPTSILFRHDSPDGWEGFPGRLIIDMSYELSESNEFIIKYKASTDKPTHVNLTHHSYFNLAGESSGSIYDHLLTLNAASFIPIDSVSIPTGEIATVEGTPFDFRTPKRIGEAIDEKNHQLEMGNGYDHCWVLEPQSSEFKLAATLYEPTSGRKMEVITDQFGIQFYSGNFFDGKTLSKDGLAKYEPRTSLALETQLFPDSPNQPHFPSSLLTPDDTYIQTCIYRFSTL